MQIHNRCLLVPLHEPYTENGNINVLKSRMRGTFRGSLPRTPHSSLSGSLKGSHSRAKHDDHGMTLSDPGDSYTPCQDHGMVIK